MEKRRRELGGKNKVDGEMILLLKWSRNKDGKLRGLFFGGVGR